MDKVTRLSTINEYENKGLNMIDLASMVKSLQLVWLKRIFGENDGAWKSYLRVSLKHYGGLFLFYCNYTILKIIMFLPFFILNYFSGGLNSERVTYDTKKRMATYTCGTTKRYK